MRIKIEQLVELGARKDRAEKYISAINKEMASHNINTPLRVAHFIAQILHESGRLKFVQENMNYSAKGLRQVFAKYFSVQKAQEYARKPSRIGSRVYANRMGNGDEASGDGFRYRGRGLIQLTGKTNYRKFSTWINDDVLNNPEKVKDQYAVHSAVYFWEVNDLNRLADRDDVKAVTKRINGGTNGLADRIELLTKAKRLFKSVAAPVMSQAPTHQVTANRLNLRSRPQVSASTRIASLSQGTEVVVLGDASKQGWVSIEVELHGQLVQGVVASRYLQKISVRSIPPVARARAMRVTPLPVSHLKENRKDITRIRDGGRAYPLGEKPRPNRVADSSDKKVKKVLKIINYLDSQATSHLRYKPKSATTYCNIYAYDYCYLAGVYLPRVWWMDKAIQQLRNGQATDVIYGKTVRELNANMLHDWFEDYGIEFGWERVLDLDLLQAHADNGEVCIIVAQRTDLNRSGHITAVVPQHDTFQAARKANGEISRPVESQAGAKNYRFVVNRSAWWSRDKFRSFGFWKHA